MSNGSGKPNREFIIDEVAADGDDGVVTSINPNIDTVDEEPKVDQFSETGDIDLGTIARIQAFLGSGDTFAEFTGAQELLKEEGVSTNDADPLAVARERGLKAFNELVESLGGLLHPDDFSALCGIPVADLPSKKLLTHEGQYFAFQTRSGQLLYGIEAVVSVLQDEGTDTAMSAQFFNTVFGELNNLSPVARLKAAHALQHGIPTPDMTTAFGVAALARVYPKRSIASI